MVTRLEWCRYSGDSDDVVMVDIPLKFPIGRDEERGSRDEPGDGILKRKAFFGWQVEELKVLTLVYSFMASNVFIHGL